MLLFSFSHYCSLHVVARFFAVLFSSLCCCFLHCLAALLFALVSFALHIATFFRLLFYFRFMVFHATILLLTLLCFPHYVILCWCIFICWRILYYSLAFFLARIGSGRESRIENQYIFSKYFSLCLFLFF